MSKRDLYAFQAEFAAAMASRDAACPRTLAGAAAERFRIYRNNFYHGLGEQLAQAYPAVRRLVGDRFFVAMAREYVAAHPPRTRSLVLFGRSFPGFLKSFSPAASLPYLPDVAMLERAWLEALHAPDIEPLAPGPLRQLGQELVKARFDAHPAARIVTSDYPIVEIWRANQGYNTSAQRGIDAVGQAALVTRPKLHVEVRTLSVAEAHFARGLFAGKDVVAAFEGTPRAGEYFDVTATFGALLTAGAFARIDSADGSRDNPNEWSFAQ